MVNKDVLKEGTGVFTWDGRKAGKISRFVLDPKTNEVTHLVVTKGWIFPEDKVVPFNMVYGAKDFAVVLHEDLADFNKLPPFEETHFIRTDDASEQTENQEFRPAPAYYWYPPYGSTGYRAYGLAFYSWPTTESNLNIPEDTVPLREGTDVISSDGKHVGDVERLFVDPVSKKATHFVISQGLLFKDQKLIPGHWIKSITEDAVHLDVSSELLERLPSYQS